VLARVTVNVPLKLGLLISVVAGVVVAVVVEPADVQVPSAMEQTS
jgi:uncharacterized integral membrane protein